MPSLQCVRRARPELTRSLSTRQVKRTLRVHLSTTVLDQPWQLGDKLKDVPAPPDSDKPGTGTINAQQAGEQAVAAAQGGQEEEGDATQVKPDFVTGRGVPKFELKVTGELLGVRRVCDGDVGVGAELICLRCALAGRRAQEAANGLCYPCRGGDGPRSYALRQDGPAGRA